MKVVVISDIHGNDVAFEAVMEDLAEEPYDRVVCLGDAVQGGPQPAEVVNRLRRLRCPTVMGNADAWLLTGAVTGTEEVISEERLRKLVAGREWSLSRLTAADLDFIRAFTPTVEIPLEAGRVLLCFHGSPASFDDFILPTTDESRFDALLGEHFRAVLTGGHTHLQQIRRTKDSFFFNPGSVGLTYDHRQSDDGFRADGWAEYAVLTSEGPRLRLDLRRVPFDVERLVEVYRASGRPFSDESIAQYLPPSGL
jgi:predicted phosphodiesterase